MTIGDTFLMYDTQSGKTRLFIVLGQRNNCAWIAFSLTSQRVQRSELILLPEEKLHDFITEPSTVQFWSPQVVHDLTYNDGCKRGIIKPQDPMPLSAVNRMIVAAIVSKRTPKYLLEYLREIKTPPTNNPSSTMAGHVSTNDR
jgi:hypothetical protein